MPFGLKTHDEWLFNTSVISAIWRLFCLHSSRLDEVLIMDIRRSFNDSAQTYGVRRIWPDLLDWGHAVGRERVARLVWSLKLVAQPGRLFLHRCKLPANRGAEIQLTALRIVARRVTLCLAIGFAARAEQKSI